MSQIKSIAILGSTGSIGTQTLDIISQHPDRFRAALLVAGTNVQLLARQARQYRPSMAIIADPSRYTLLQQALEGTGIETAAGAQAITEAMRRTDFTQVVTATVGYSGLIPTIEAIKADKEIALANKETLVVAGELVTRLLREHRTRLLPVDSEHSAIYQCLMGEDPATVAKLIITASGGPFRGYTKDRLKEVTVDQALRHPKWDMGAKITIDSATMLNKAFEIIEAHWLFGVEAERIEAVVHPQSIIHSMVQFTDGAVKAQLGLPDMHLPIRYALGDACRLTSPAPAMTIADYASLTFERPDPECFPCLTLAHEALDRRGNTACIINAANEVAVAQLLSRQIKYTDIYPIITSTLERADFVAEPTLDDYVESHRQATALSRQIASQRATGH